MKIKSDFAILDVKDGRSKLYAHFRTKTNRTRPNAEKIPVTITGWIVDVWGDDDGVSREFTIDVASVEIDAP